MEHDVASDYGSDFTPDEEEILHRLLQPTPSTHVQDPDLVLNDLDDDETLQGAKVHWMHVRQQQQKASSSPRPNQKQSSHLPVEMADNSTASADSEPTLDRDGTIAD